MADAPLLPDTLPFVHRAPGPTEAPVPPSDSEVPPPPTKLQLREKLKGFINELLTITDARQMRELNLTIQRHVVALQLSNVTDGDGDFDAADLQKQMTLLNRMLEGEPLDPAGAGGALPTDDQERAAEVLAARGIDPLQAARLAGVLGALMSRAGATEPVSEVAADGPR